MTNTTLSTPEEPIIGMKLEAPNIDAETKVAIMTEIYRFGIELEEDIFHPNFSYDEAPLLHLCIPENTWLYADGQTPFYDCDSLSRYLKGKWTALHLIPDSTRFLVTTRPEYWTREKGHNNIDEHCFQLSLLLLSQTKLGRHIIDELPEDDV